MSRTGRLSASPWGPRDEPKRATERRYSSERPVRRPKIVRFADAKLPPAPPPVDGQLDLLSECAETVNDTRTDAS